MSTHFSNPSTSRDWLQVERYRYSFGRATTHILYLFFNEKMSSRFAKESRSRTRTAVTKFFNNRANFDTYDAIKLNNTKLKLERAVVEQHTKVMFSADLASKEVQKFNVLRQLCELMLSNSGESFQFISDVRKIIQTIKSRVFPS